MFAELRKPYLLAHRGGSLLAPMNTMAAFDVADAIGVDFLDIDVHLTKDGHVVGIHDNTVDNTTDGQGRVDNYTLAELQELDAGYRFRDERGEYSYRGKGVRIPSIEEIFEKYAEKHHFHFEIKDTYPKGGPSEIEERLWKLIQRYHLEEKVIVASFKQAIVARFNRVAGGKVILGAGSAEVTRFALAHKIRMPGLYRPYAHVLEIPLASHGVVLKDRRIIEGAHRLGMEVYYWTIDDKATMQELLDMGADGIFTDRPDLLKEVLQERGLR